MSELVVADGIGHLEPDADPESVAPALARTSPSLLLFSEPVPEPLLEATAAALAEHPEIGLRVYRETVDPSLGWLEHFPHVRNLAVDLWHATSFDAVAGLGELRELSLGETASKRPSLAFVRELPRLEVLAVEGHDREFAAIADVPTLRELHLRVPRAKTLDPLRGHPRLQVVEIDFGGIRDLTPLAEIPNLRALALYQVRKLDTEDLSALGRCTSLVAISLGALRNVQRLTALAERPRTTLRYATLETMGGLETLADLGECEALEQLYLVDSRPRDRRLDLVARARALRHLVVGDHYTAAEVEAANAVFASETLWVRGKAVRGEPESEDVHVGWRRPVADYLKLAAGRRP